MEQKLCCRGFIHEIMDRYLHHGQRITFDTNLEKYFGKKCEFKHGDNKCNLNATYVVTLTARFEVPPFPHSLEKLTNKAEHFKSEFMK